MGSNKRPLFQRPLTKRAPYLQIPIKSKSHLPIFSYKATLFSNKVISISKNLRLLPITFFNHKDIFFSHKSLSFTHKNTSMTHKTYLSTTIRSWQPPRKHHWGKRSTISNHTQSNSYYHRQSPSQATPQKGETFNSSWCPATYIRCPSKLFYTPPYQTKSSPTRPLNDIALVAPFTKAATSWAPQNGSRWNLYIIRMFASLPQATPLEEGWGSIFILSLLTSTTSWMSSTNEMKKNWPRIGYLLRTS